MNSKSHGKFMLRIFSKSKLEDDHVNEDVMLFVLISFLVFLVKIIILFSGSSQKTNGALENQMLNCEVTDYSFNP